MRRKLDQPYHVSESTFSLRLSLTPPQTALWWLLSADMAESETGRAPDPVSWRGIGVGEFILRNRLAQNRTSFVYCG